MSRIYDALKYSEADRSAALLQLIDEEHDHASADSPDVPPVEPAAELQSLSLLAERDDHRIVPQDAPAHTIPPNPPPRLEPRTVSAATPPGTPVFPFGGPDSRASEHYRILRTNLVQHELAPRIIAVTSAAPGDGKTITAINIAGILALKGDARVLLIDADLRQRALARTVGIPSTPGLTDVIQGHTSFEEAAVRITQLPGLSVLPAGTVSGKPSELLDSPLFRATVESLRAQFTYVVVDTTPMTAVTDFKLVQQICDGVLVVVRPDHTNRAIFAKAMEVQQKDKFLGTVVNAVEDWFLWNTNDHYKYYSSRPTSGARPAGTRVVVRYKSKKRQ
jgi:capsular exopolysaccharide synthesis family protein